MSPDTGRVPLEVPEDTAPPVPAPGPGYGPLAAMLLAGVTLEQLSRLADMRVRALRGSFDDDGFGTRHGSRLADRRYEFARWLVQTGRLHDGRAQLRDEPAAGR